ncbi:unnamed protein product [Blepharisma stoltei]|uniref:Uncharacterized protein n=1 Tax=Blepharisma stoltei TaxID=1481888 RepID=A0AAU9JBM9_9CILI|nr:unnamed protein product [Blepharisma stoltei]
MSSVNHLVIPDKIFVDIPRDSEKANSAAKNPPDSGFVWPTLHPHSKSLLSSDKAASNSFKYSYQASNPAIYNNEDEIAWPKLELQSSSVSVPADSPQVDPTILKPIQNHLEAETEWQSIQSHSHSSKNSQCSNLDKKENSEDKNLNNKPAETAKLGIPDKTFPFVVNSHKKKENVQYNFQSYKKEEKVSQDNYVNQYRLNPHAQNFQIQTEKSAKSWGVSNKNVQKSQDATKELDDWDTQKKISFTGNWYYVEKKYQSIVNKVPNEPKNSGRRDSNNFYSIPNQEQSTMDHSVPRQLKIEPNDPTTHSWISPKIDYTCKPEEFDLITYKTIPCKIGSACTGLCPRYHYQGEKRRSPSEYNYIPELCCKVGNCQLGDRCIKAHNIIEILYHPQVYLTFDCPYPRLSNGCYLGQYCNFTHINNPESQKNVIDQHRLALEKVHQKHAQLEEFHKKLVEKEEEIKCLENSILCKCKENLKRVIMIPCGHAFCELCANEVACAECGKIGKSYPIQ